ncbi:hypothetical protein BUALT_Bualt03G0068500 [Buddleja alternifolia]|uniref:Uncharacterized protein n=1 Tax=Buddleja alternifolia TaxID=168488 RepID=A0AAV6XYE4_9LAMI|nr:hypothetical protein BUALT_Bualt03G0068500 [Buddleja alternifolia]
MVVLKHHNLILSHSHRQHNLLHIIMKRAEIPNSLLLLLFTAIIVLYSFFPRFCTSQGNSSSSNSCATYGRCGYYGSCNSQSSLICTCLRGFDPSNKQEWDAGNWTSGCVRRVPLNCDSNNGNGSTTTGVDGFLKLQMMKISGYSDRWSGPENECEGRCLRNCSCMAYGYDVSKLWTEENVVALIDPRISSPSYQEEVVRCIHIGLLCVEELPEDRPSVSAVLSMLISEILELPKPKQAAFCIKRSRSALGTSSSRCSRNNVTVSMVEGR